MPHNCCGAPGGGAGGGEGDGGGGLRGGGAGGGAVGAQPASASARLKHVVALSKDVVSPAHATHALPFHALPAAHGLAVPLARQHRSNTQNAASRVAPPRVCA